MKFKDQNHEELYKKICGKMRYLDTYHQALAYLLALDTVCRNHISDIYDIAEDSIKTNCINKEWQTSTSKKTIRLAFNLWNGTTSDITSDEEEKNSNLYSVDEIFCCEYAPFYWESIKLRYPEYM